MLVNIHDLLNYSVQVAQHGTLAINTSLLGIPSLSPLSPHHQFPLLPSLKGTLQKNHCALESYLWPFSSCHPLFLGQSAHFTNGLNGFAFSDVSFRKFFLIFFSLILHLYINKPLL